MRPRGPAISAATTSAAIEPAATAARPREARRPTRRLSDAPAIRGKRSSLLCKTIVVV
jgi:hypothetical protein